MINYDTLPFKVFHQVLMDEEANLHLLGIKDLKEAKKEWDAIKEEWVQRHPSPEQRDVLQAYKNAMTRSIELSKLIAALKYMAIFTDVDPEKQKEVFKEARIRWNDDPLKRLEALNKMLKKAQTEKQIHDARYEKLVKEVKEAKEQEKKIEKKMSIADINKSIASLEMAGFSIDNYETLTCGKYDAMSAILRAQNEKLKQNGNR